MKKVLAILLALTLCVGMISGCTKIAKDDPAAKGAELEVYMGTKVLNLDPAASYTDENAVQILGLIFEGLTKLDENGKLKKALAKKIEITEDNINDLSNLDLSFPEIKKKVYVHVSGEGEDDFKENEMDDIYNLYLYYLNKIYY